MPNEAHDIIIIGGGIGGGALATVLARAGKDVLVLEKSTVYRDRVRGEWMAPWGAAEAKRMGLYDAIIEAGGHHLSRNIGYSDALEPAEAEAAELPMDALMPGIPGPLTLGHPKHCDTLHDTAVAAGANVLRDVNVTSVTLGTAPSVAYTHSGAEHTTRAKIIIGADGRGSIVRRAANIELHRDAQHHLFSGMLVEDAHGFPDDLQITGAENDAHFLAFPQGNGRIRLYLGYSTSQPQRLTGPHGQRAFLDAFKLTCMPLGEHLHNATPAGPCNSYPNEDAWTVEPFAEGMVLVGDAGGWNDPIIGQGLSITYRDVRIVSGIMLNSDDWSPAAFAPYAEERAERMRRLRFVAALQSSIENEFGDEARARRRRVHERQQQDPTFVLPLLAVLLGPDAVPPVAFEQSLRDRLLA